MTKFYAGVGSRETPPEILALMENIAYSFSCIGWALRSGHADGADKAFEKRAVPGLRQIMLPWNGYNGAKIDNLTYFDGYTEELEMVARHYHPAWERCSQGVRRLHTRNVAILLGTNLDLDPSVKAVVCWTKDGKASGGTGQAIRIAEAYLIPVFNLQHDDALDRLGEFVDQC